MPEQPNQELEIENLKDRVVVFAKEARRPNAKGSVCGDGGVPDQVKTTKGKEVVTSGYLGDLGQDLATVTAIAAYNLKHGIDFVPSDLTGQVASTYVETHGQFLFHTAGHVHPPVKITDCGDMHGKMTPEYAKEYGLSEEIGREIVEAAQDLAEADEVDEVVEQDLEHREHQEQGVIIITGKTHSLTHWLKDGEAKGMWFVLDPERAIERRKLVLEKMGYDDEAVREILAIKEEQDQVTRERLTVGKHVFGVNADDESNVQVDYLGRVQTDGSVN